MNHQTIDEADHEVTGERKRKESWKDLQSQETMREADAILRQFKDPRTWAWRLKNSYAKHGTNLDLEEMVRIISPLGDKFAPSQEQHERLMDYIEKQVKAQASTDKK